ncbi:hypothetical protein [Tautonia sociabilis]|uniref:Uncharacterized protein n=1 Tax=Tautonia sociabilis TaxID=2080755 RepID=A0A432MP25_9BACT|nr:hypothetical protein [Tautonia sociabilis]RUL88856.1 hypothetical protein TsocGM_04395 [Tautonia sociabilis]
MKINDSAPILVDAGANARVAMGRTNGTIAVAYIDTGGSVIGGHGINATTNKVKTYNLTGTLCILSPLRRDVRRLRWGLRHDLRIQAESSWFGLGGQLDPNTFLSEFRRIAVVTAYRVDRPW